MPRSSKIRHFCISTLFARTELIRYCYDMANRLLPPVLTRRRIWLACAVAVAVDTIQLLLGPFGWAGPDEVIDIAVMVLLTAIIGFHPLFLPTFVAEFIPMVDSLPTWTACTLIVIGLRRKHSVPPVTPPSPAQSTGDVIDVGADVRRL
jgi:hypothetical protein